MSWQDRDDLWHGLAFLRPAAGTANVSHGGAFAAFFVVGDDIRAATERAFAAFAQEGWLLTSFEAMKRACDYQYDDDDGVGVDPAEQDKLAAAAADNGVALGVFHVFPQEEAIVQ